MLFSIFSYIKKFPKSKYKSKSKNDLPKFSSLEIFFSKKHG
jgi:hypothetical protein